MPGSAPPSGATVMLIGENVTVRTTFDGHNPQTRRNDKKEEGYGLMEICNSPVETGYNWLKIGYNPLDKSYDVFKIKCGEDVANGLSSFFAKVFIHFRTL